MERYLYTAWFCDQLAEPDDQDREWPACFVVEASSPENARNWGDHVATAFAQRRASEEFLWSSIEVAEGLAPQGMPLVQVGRDPTDAEIGW